MLAEDLRLLRAHESWPCVSVLGPSTPTDVAHGIELARRRLRDELGADQADRLADRLEAVDVSVDSTRPGAGVFVSPRLTHVVAFPQAVRPRVVVDSTFATRDIVTTLVRHPRYRVLELDGEGARLWAGLGDELEPARTSAFPVVLPAPDGPSERRRRRDPSQLWDAQLQRAVREVDAALDDALAADDPRPLFVVGDRSRAPRHVGISRHAGAVTEIVPGRARGEPGRLHALVADAVARSVHRQRCAAIEEVGAAISGRRFASGIAEVWALAREGRGDLLVVDERYHTPAIVEPDSGQLTVVDEPRTGGIDDAVDDAIEFVIDHGGRVSVVDDAAALAPWGRIAMKLRH